MKFLAMPWCMPHSADLRRWICHFSTYSQLFSGNSGKFKGFCACGLSNTKTLQTNLLCKFIQYTGSFVINMQILTVKCLRYKLTVRINSSKAANYSDQKPSLGPNIMIAFTSNLCVFWLQLDYNYCFTVTNWMPKMLILLLYFHRPSISVHNRKVNCINVRSKLSNGSTLTVLMHDHYCTVCMQYLLKCHRS